MEISNPYAVIPIYSSQPHGSRPAYSLKGLLKRAEIVYVGRVSELSLEKQPAMLSTDEGRSHISDRKIQLDVVEVLWGNKGDIKGNYGLLGLGDMAEIELGDLLAHEFAVGAVAASDSEFVYAKELRPEDATAYEQAEAQARKERRGM